SGTIVANNSNALGTGPVFIGDPAVTSNNFGLLLGNNVVLTNPLTFTSGTSSTAGRASLQVASGNSATYNGAMTVSGTRIDQMFAAGTLTVQGTVTGLNAAPTTEFFLRGGSLGVGSLQSVVNIFPGFLAKTDSGTWTISSTGNSWAGTTVAVGILKLGASN